MSTENVMMIIIVVLIVLIVVFWLMNKRKSYVENFEDAKKTLVADCTNNKNENICKSSMTSDGDCKWFTIGKARVCANPLKLVDNCDINNPKNHKGDDISYQTILNCQNSKTTNGNCEWQSSKGGGGSCLNPATPVVKCEGINDSYTCINSKVSDHRCRWYIFPNRDPKKTKTLCK
jgi:hypothetical protein